MHRPSSATTGRARPGGAQPADRRSRCPHLLLGHGLAVEAFRASGRFGSVGPHAQPQPRRAGRRSRGGRSRDAALRRPPQPLVPRPGLPGDVPVRPHRALREPGRRPRVVAPGDMAIISRPIDFLGVNYYFRNSIEATAADLRLEGIEGPGRGRDDRRRVEHRPVRAQRHARPAPDGVPAHPDIYVTENGVALDDTVGPEGPWRTHDGSTTRAALRGGSNGRSPTDVTCKRLLRLVAAGQLRVGARLPDAVRARPRGLRDPAADSEAQRSLVPRPDRLVSLERFLACRARPK